MPDEGKLLRDAAVLYQLCLEAEGSDLSVFDAFTSFADRYGVSVPEEIHRVSHGSVASSFTLDSQDGAENHTPDIKDLRMRFEWAIRAIEELGIIRRQTRGDHIRLCLELFND